MGNRGQATPLGQEVTPEQQSQLYNDEVARQSTQKDVWDYVDTPTALAAVFLPSEAPALLAGNAQKAAASEAARQAQIAGDQGAQAISGAGQGAAADLTAGRDAGLANYDQALSDARGYQAGLGGLYAQERAGGQQSLQQLNDILLNGDTSHLQTDPSYNWRLQQQQQALERQSAANGSYGGGAHYKQLLQLNQQMASREYQNAIDRLMGMASVGQDANLGYANFQQDATNNILGLYGAQAGLLSETGQQLGSLRQNTAAQMANAWNGQASNVNDYNIQGANAQAGTLATVNQDLGRNAQTFNSIYSTYNGAPQAQAAAAPAPAAQPDDSYGYSWRT